MEFIFKHVWIFFVLVTALNAVILCSRSKKYIKDKPELKVGYEKYF
jgi:hypothetical protein